MPGLAKGVRSLIRKEHAACSRVPRFRSRLERRCNATDLVEPAKQYSCIIPHHKKVKVLLFAKDGKWEVPGACVVGDPLRNPTPKLRKVLTVYGIGEIGVSLLRFARLSDECTVWQCQNDDRSWRPPSHGRWVSQDELATLALVDPTIRTELETWFQEFGSPPPGRAPWECQGWWDGPMQWIRDQLPGNADPKVDRSQDGKVCSLWNYAVRIRTANEGLFFKAVRNWNSFEPALTHVLAELFPQNLPEVLAINEQEGWILMKDFGRHLEKDEGDLDLLHGAVRGFAELQIESLDYLDKIAATGCPDLRNDQIQELETLFDRIANMLSDSPVQGIAQKCLLIPRCLQIAKSVVSDLSSFKIPPALVHGDFTYANIAARKASGQYVFFDWGDSCISHPFMSMVMFARFSAYWKELLPTYLQSWTTYAPLDALKNAFDLAKCLEQLYAIRREVEQWLHVEKPMADAMLAWIAGDVEKLAKDS